MNGHRQEVKKGRRQPQRLARYDIWEHRSEEEQRACIEHWTVVVVTDNLKDMFRKTEPEARVTARADAAA